MPQRFQVGDRVIAIDEQAAGVPMGTSGIVALVIVGPPEICDVRFADHSDLQAVRSDALAPGPPELAE
jgi:hypothetical protein